MHSGIIYVDKPAGITSFDIIRRLRRALQIKKMGHSGTLDPFATGLCLVFVGKATKALEYAITEDKTYEATVVFGKKTNTGDTEGEVIESQPQLKNLSLNSEVLKKKVIQIKDQVPPKYSAIKINGKKAYDLARQDKDFEIPKREIIIHDFEIVELSTSFLRYRATVSKGTYIRTLSEQIAALLGTIGYTSTLRRTAIGSISIVNATPLDEITQNWKPFFKPLTTYPFPFPTIMIDDEQTNKLKQGLQITLDFEDQKTVLVSNNNEAVAFGNIKGNKFRPKKVLI